MIETRILTNAEILKRTAPGAHACDAAAGEELKGGAKKKVARLATDMIDIAAVTGACEEADLLLRGWTPEALAAHADAARILANAASDGGRV